MIVVYPSPVPFFYVQGMSALHEQMSLQGVRGWGIHQKQSCSLSCSYLRINSRIYP